jgi:O-antigen/teichoic acid export membrane protein
MVIAKRFSYYGASRLAVVFGQFILLPIAVAQLGVAGYGTYNLMLQSAMLIRLIALQAVAQTIVREHELIIREFGADEAYSNGLSIVAVNLLIASILIIVFADKIASQFGFSDKQMWLILAMSLASSLFGLKQAIIFSSNFPAYCKSDVVHPLSVITFSILIAVLFPNVETYAIVYTVATLLISIAMFRLRYKLNSLRGNLKKFSGLVRSYGLPLMLGEIFGWVISVSDRFQIAAQLDLTKTGTYASAYQLFVMPIALLGVATVMQSVVVSCNVDEYRARMEKAATVTFMISCAYLLGVLLFGEYLFSTVFRGKMSVDLSFILVLASAGVAYSFYHLELISGKYARKTGVILFAQACGGLVLLAGNWMLLPIMGIMAAAITSLLAYILQVTILKLMVDDIYHFRYFSFQSSIEILSRLSVYLRKLGGIIL